MDLETKARIKINSRLVPAKDIQIAFGELLSCVDPDNFENLKEKLILAIDSAEKEFEILEMEVNTLKTAKETFGAEIQRCTSDMANIAEQLEALELEKESIQKQIQDLNEKERVKSELIKANLPNKLVSIAKREEIIQRLQEELRNTRENNMRRQDGWQEVISGFKKFLLLDPTENTENVE